MATLPPYAAALRQLLRAPRVLVSRSQRLYINYVVCRDYSSPSRMGSTSTTLCAATTHLPVARVLHQLRRAPQLLISRSHGFYINYALSRDYSSSRLHRLYCAYAVHPDAPSRCSTSRQSVALALVMCPVISLCDVTTRLAAATDILRLRRASGCLGTLRGSSRGSLSTTSTTSQVRLLWHVARLVVDYFASRRLVVDYFAYAARPGASARRADRHTAHHRLLRLA
jgi:hypothetical protein